MKKISKILSTIIFSFMVFTNYVFAYGYDLSVTSNSVTVGNSITLNIKVSDAAGKFSISSSNSSVVSVSSSNAWIDNGTQSITLKANKEGSAVITVSANDVTSYSGNSITGSKSVTINVKAKQVVSNNTPTGGNNKQNAGTKATPKSSNNFLTSLTVDGLKLNENFDKETLEYTLTVPAETEKIKINAQVNDSNAKVTGTGEVKVSTGINNFDIIVTAENGSKRTYKIIATVEELKPIKVTIDNQEYTVVRKRKELPEISEYFEEKNITINNETIEGYYNEKLDYTIVGLKNSKGNIEYYIYKNNKYTLYKEYVFNGTVLQVLDEPIKGGYKKVNFIYDDDKIDSYQEVKLDILKNTYALDNNDITGNQFYLFYAKNVETGKVNLYQYDALEKTVQRYNIEVLDMYKKSSNTYYMYLLISILVIVVLVVCIIIKSIIKGKKKENIKNKKKHKEIEEDEE